EHEFVLAVIDHHEVRVQPLRSGVIELQLDRGRFGRRLIAHGLGSGKENGGELYGLVAISTFMNCRLDELLSTGVVRSLRRAPCRQACASSSLASSPYQHQGG